MIVLVVFVIISLSLKVRSYPALCPWHTQNLSIAVSITVRQDSRLVVFFQAESRPKFEGFSSSSSALSQSGDGFWIAGARGSKFQRIFRVRRRISPHTSAAAAAAERRRLGNSAASRGGRRRPATGVIT